MQRGNCFAQIVRKRLPLSDDINAFLFNLGLKCVEESVAVDNLMSEFCISLRESVKCFLDLLLCEPTHLRDHPHEIL